MPQGLVALLPALITAGTAGTEIGLQASGAFQPSTTASTQAATQAAEAAAKQREGQSMRAVAGNAQEAAPGLSDASMAQLIATMVGSPGDIGLAQQTVFGNPPSSGTTVFGGSGQSGLATTVG